MKKVLILSCNTGQGHNSCAQAIQAYFEERSVPCDIQDALSFISPGFSGFISWGHSTVYRYFPWLFRWGYRWAEKHPGMFAEKTFFHSILTKGTSAMYHHILSGGYDTVICTHIFAAIALTDITRKTPLPVQTALLATDYTCSPGVDAVDVRWYFVPHASLIKEFTAMGVPGDRIVVSGIPARREFYRHVEKADAKRLLSIPPEHKHLLISCGSMGCGHIQKILRLLADKMPGDLDISVICGTNTRLARKLNRKYHRDKNIHIQGYSNEMPLYMDSADLYLTKPGGITVTEAAVKRLPMVLNNAVSGCEEYNMRFFTRCRGAYAARSPQKLARQCLKRIYADDDLRRMRSALESCGSSGVYDIWTALGGEEQRTDED